MQGSMTQTNGHVTEKTTLAPHRSPPPPPALSSAPPSSSPWASRRLGTTISTRQKRERRLAHSGRLPRILRSRNTLCRHSHDAKARRSLPLALSRTAPSAIPGERGPASRCRSRSALGRASGGSPYSWTTRQSAHGLGSQAGGACPPPGDPGRRGGGRRGACRACPPSRACSPVERPWTV
jgi:hypothetical protein